MDKVYGKLRKEDLPILESAIRIFKRHNLKVGLHGTSLWNPNYKDIDILVTSPRNRIKDFAKALEELKKKHKTKILNQKGNETVGLDYDLKIGKTVLHISYVILL